MINYKILANNKNYACFKIKNDSSGSLGLAVTLGNAFRRVLLNNIIGSAVSSFTVNSPLNNKLKIKGLKEDIFEFSSNLKKLNIKSLKLKPSLAKIKTRGPLVITGEDLVLSEGLVIVNPKQYICNIVTNNLCDIELNIEQGFGYKFYDEKFNCFSEINKNFIIDANFSPIIKVNYKTTLENSVFFKNKLTEVLFLEIWTNGTITPKRAFFETCKFLSTVFSSFLF